MVKKSTAIIAVVVAVLALAAIVGAVLLTPTNDGTQKVVYWSTVAPVNQKAAIADGTVSAGVSWEPYVSDSLVAGSADVIAWSGDIWPNHPCCVLAVSTSFAQNYPDAAARLLRADIEANIWLNDALSHPDSANYTLLLNMGAQFSGRSTEVVNASMAHIVYRTTITAQDESWFVNFTNDFQNLGLYNANITEKGYANATDYVNHLVDNSVMASAMAVQPSDHIVANVSLGYLTGDLHQFARVIASNDTVGGGQSLFEKYGVSVSTPNPAGYANGGAVMDAFKAGTIDMGYLGAPPALLKVINSGVDIKIISLVNSEGSAIIAAKGITSFDQLNGKTIATPGPASIQHLLLLFYADEMGYKVKLSGT